MFSSDFRRAVYNVMAVESRRHRQSELDIKEKPNLSMTEGQPNFFAAANEF